MPLYQVSGFQLNMRQALDPFTGEPLFDENGQPVLVRDVYDNPTDDPVDPDDPTDPGFYYGGGGNITQVTFNDDGTQLNNSTEVAQNLIGEDIGFAQSVIIGGVEYPLVEVRTVEVSFRVPMPSDDGGIPGDLSTYQLFPLIETMVLVTVDDPDAPDSGDHTILIPLNGTQFTPDQQPVVTDLNFVDAFGQGGTPYDQLHDMSIVSDGNDGFYQSVGYELQRDGMGDIDPNAVYTATLTADIRDPNAAPASPENQFLNGGETDVTFTIDDEVYDVTDAAIVLVDFTDGAGVAHQEYMVLVDLQQGVGPGAVQTEYLVPFLSNPDDLTDVDPSVFNTNFTAGSTIQAIDENPADPPEDLNNIAYRMFAFDADEPEVPVTEQPLPQFTYAADAFLLARTDEGAVDPAATYDEINQFAIEFIDNDTTADGGVVEPTDATGGQFIRFVNHPTIPEGTTIPFANFATDTSSAAQMEVEFTNPDGAVVTETMLVVDIFVDDLGESVEVLVPPLGSQMDYGAQVNAVSPLDGANLETGDYLDYATPISAPVPEPYQFDAQDADLYEQAQESPPDTEGALDTLDWAATGYIIPQEQQLDGSGEPVLDGSGNPIWIDGALTVPSGDIQIAFDVITDGAVDGSQIHFGNGGIGVSESVSSIWINGVEYPTNDPAVSITLGLTSFHNPSLNAPKGEDGEYEDQFVSDTIEEPMIRVEIEGYYESGQDLAIQIPMQGSQFDIDSEFVGQLPVGGNFVGDEGIADELFGPLNVGDHYGPGGPPGADPLPVNFDLFSQQIGDLAPEGGVAPENDYPDGANWVAEGHLYNADPSAVYDSADTVRVFFQDDDGNLEGDGNTDLTLPQIVTYNGESNALQDGVLVEVTFRNPSLWEESGNIASYSGTYATETMVLLTVPTEGGVANQEILIPLNGWDDQVAGSQFGHGSMIESISVIEAAPDDPV
ncbi:MAG: hypothetical protein AAF982_09065, partial [Pseudomonadota bacterium]